MRAQLQQTMIRVKDAAQSIAFFRDNFHMTHIATMPYPQWNFSVSFMATLSPEDAAEFSSAADPLAFLWTKNAVFLELTHNFGTEADDSFTVNNGNLEPHRGFGHIAFNVDDVYKTCETLEANGVKFHKKPNEGRMKGIAFALSPEGYWIEIVPRDPNYRPGLPFNFSQTMIRVKDAEKSLKFYTETMGMKVLTEKHFDKSKGDFSLYFLADPSQCLGETDHHKLWHPVLELTHNHGTESQADFKYHNGNDAPQGFGHIGFLVDDLKAWCDQPGLNFKKRPEEGNMKELAFIYDPDGYAIEIIQRGFGKY